MTSSDSHSVSEKELTEIFGFPNPRSAQEKGMERLLETAGNNGFLLLEGACGTGKTMLALTPLISLLRDDSTNFERILVITSVKQQQEAFENDIEQINANLPAGVRPVSAVTLAGKSDLCPYVREGIIPTEDIYGECERVRENTRELVGVAQSSAQKARKLSKEAEPENYFAEKLVRDDEFKETNYPYAGVDPEQAHGFCPFYAQHTANKIESSGADKEKQAASRRKPNKAIPYNLSSYGVATVDDLLKEAGSAGTCPHSVMGEALTEAEIVIANYYHVFDPQTVNRMTNDIIDENTLIVADEAHNLVSKVRDLLGESISLYSIERATKEVETIRELASFNNAHLKKMAQIDESRFDALRNTDTSSEVFLQTLGLSSEEAKTGDQLLKLVDNRETMIKTIEEAIKIGQKVNGLIGQSPVEKTDIDDYKDYLEDLSRFLHKQSSNTVEEEYGNTDLSTVEDAIEIPLRDPTQRETDNLTWWSKQKGYSEFLNEKSGMVGRYMESVYAYLYNDLRDVIEMPTIHSKTVGLFFETWREEDNVEFFRELELYPRRNTNYEGWRRHFKAEIHLKNCIPSNKISRKLNRFGGGILMSATLAPMDVYKDVTGLSNIEDRPVEEEIYGLEYPEKNRLSLGVDATKFKYDKKKGVRDKTGNANLSNEVRQNYAEVLKQISETTPGNILVSMPSYSEAWWAGQILEESPRVKKPILVDQSSANWKTEQLKKDFFKGGPKILVTSSRGTLIEGVDYESDKLKASVVCGVPLENARSPYLKAVKTAYEKRFGENQGYEYAFTIPAVQKARQALGRVIRSETDKGIRVLVDERYVDGEIWDSVKEYIPEPELKEIQSANSENIGNQIEAFWKYHDEY